MDHYSHEQVTIFLIMVFRHRTEKEKLLSGTATFSLPEHLTCELHAFFSEDKTKDAGFAQLCLTKYLDDAEDPVDIPYLATCKTHTDHASPTN